jgi:exosortase B
MEVGTPSLSKDALPKSSLGFVAAGLLLLYIPTFLAVGQKVWTHEDYAHGPIVLAVILFLFWQLRTRILSARHASLPLLGWPALLVGLAAYVLGRSQSIYIVDIGSLLLVLPGILLILGGGQMLRAAWFPIAFLVFLAPLPEFVVDTLTSPLKRYVSAISEAILYHLDYPVARTGVTIVIGQYELLVAGACSGLNSMFSLTALGILYLYLVHRPAVWHNAVVIGALLPIAFISNVIRVVILILITYYFGDAAGRGFAHGFAGMVLFIAALTMILGLDHLLTSFGRRHGTTPV